VPRAERERQMVEAAERVFAQRGYHGASMDEIAAECSVTKPMLYAYFGSKEGLFAACGVPAGERFRKRLRDVAGDKTADPAERLWRAFRAIFARVAENRETWTLLYPPEGPTPGGPMGARAAMNRAAMTELVGQLLREAAAAQGVDENALAQLDALSHALVGAALGLASFAADHPEEPSDVQALRLMNLVWRGLESLQQGDIWMPPEWRA
jgi:AcrR family transcriptional regulator